MSKLKYIWYVEIDDIFNGYGIRATGRTEKEAIDAMWEIYKTNAPHWEGIKFGETRRYKTLNEMDEWHGVGATKYEIGKGYFGRDGERE